MDEETDQPEDFHRCTDGTRLDWSIARLLQRKEIMEQDGSNGESVNQGLAPRCTPYRRGRRVRPQMVLADRVQQAQDAARMLGSTHGCQLN